MTKKLYKSTDDRMVAGVAGGLAEYFGIDPIIIRVLFVVSVLAGGAGIIAYIILMIVMPEQATTQSSSSTKESEKAVINDEANYTMGFILMALGVLLLIDQFTLFPVAKLWPILLIALSLGIIFNGVKKK